MIEYFYRNKDKLCYQLAHRHNPNGGIMSIALQLDSTETAMLACKDVPGWECVNEPEFIDEYYCNLETDDFGDYEEDYDSEESNPIKKMSKLRQTLNTLKNDDADLTFSSMIVKQPDGSYRQIDTTPNSNRAEHILNLIRNRKYGDDPENSDEE